MYRRSILPVAAVVFLAAPAAAQKETGLETAELSCSGPFAADATEADVIAAFGAENVTLEEWPGPEGIPYQATVIDADDSQRWIQIVWRDEVSRSGPQRITAGPAWQFPAGLSLDMSLAEVEAANCGPFLLYGFAWDYGGTVSDWQGGALGTGDCLVNVRFQSTTNVTAGMGDSTFSSDDPDILANEPIVSELSIAPQPAAPGK